jgi:uncharacterized membrane protein YsdA (DUF1294 family)/cold shock CspA family protein
VARGGMDSLHSPCGRTSCVCRRHAPRLNHRHADFQSRAGSPEALYFNELPGRPLPKLQHNAGRCRASSRKIHAANLGCWCHRIIAGNIGQSALLVLSEFGTTLRTCMRSKGKITSWNDDKGYGFVTPLAGGKQVFVHVKAFSNRNRRPEIGEVVTYSLSKDKQGRPCAANATLAGDKLKEKKAQKSSTPAILFALLFLCIVGVSVIAGRVPVIIGIAYATLSLVSFVAYALDKSAAQRGAWRTSEGTLQVLGLIGGWPGALIAQQTLRHKSKKSSFRIVFWTTVLMNCAALMWLHTKSGQSFLETVLGQHF